MAAALYGSSGAVVKSKKESLSNDNCSHAVSRSSELLSCAKMALKIGQSQQSRQSQDLSNGRSSIQQQSSWWLSQDPGTLRLHSVNSAVSSSEESGSILQVTEDGLALLRSMDTELSQLEKLVRRRGHTNDPTEEISKSVQRLETDAQELSTLVETGFRTSGGSGNKQYQKHLSHVAHWLETVAAQQLQKLKEILKVRGNVLADQAQRRKLLNPANSNTSKSTIIPGTAPTNSTATPNANSTTTAFTTRTTVASSNAMVASPLFTMTSPLAASSTRIKQIHKSYNNSHSTSSSSNNINNTYSSNKTGTNSSYQYGSSRVRAGDIPTAAAGNQYYSNEGAGGYYGAATSDYCAAGAYGGATSSITFRTGMRQRKNNPTTTATTTTSGQRQQQRNGYNYYDNGDSSSTTDSSTIANQIQERQYQRETQNRLRDAQKAEKTMAHLGMTFTKMSTFISQQSELIEKVEDDMEAGLAEVTLGQQEIQTVYGIKKGNRGLIIKVFALLIFLIIFMKYGFSSKK